MEKLPSNCVAMTKGKYIIKNVENLTQADRQNIISLILMFDEKKNIKELASGLAYNLDKAPEGLVDLIYVYIEKKLEQYREQHDYISISE